MPQSPRKHQPQHKRTRRHRSPAKEKTAYNRRAWRDRIRPAKLARDPLCEDCYDRHIIKPAEHVDHIDGNPWNNRESNLMSLCVTDHSMKTAREDGSFGAAVNRDRELAPVTIVCGAAGSGKTTYVEQHRAANDLVYDLDALGEALCPGWGRYESRPKEISLLILRWRDSLVHKIRQREIRCPCWIIIADREQADEVAVKIDAEVIDLGRSPYYARNHAG